MPNPEIIRLPRDMQGPDPYGKYEMGVCCNPGGRFHGWLFRRHPDGQWVSWRRLETEEIGALTPNGPRQGIPEHEQGEKR